MGNLSKLLNASEVACKLSIHVETLYKIKHDIGFVRIGRSIKFKVEDVSDYIQRRCSK